MELKRINTQTNWGEAVNGINSNNQKIAIKIANLEQLQTKNLGYFNTLNSLTQTRPTANENDIAYVGTKYPFDIYTYKQGRWIKTGIGGTSANLNDYLMSETITNVIDILDTI